MRSIDRGENIDCTISSGQINRAYKLLARQASLDPVLIANISRDSFRVGAAQDFVASGASMATIMK